MEVILLSLFLILLAIPKRNGSKTSMTANKRKKKDEKTPMQKYIWDSVVCKFY